MEGWGTSWGYHRHCPHSWYCWRHAWHLPSHPILHSTCCLRELEKIWIKARHIHIKTEEASCTTGSRSRRKLLRATWDLSHHILECYVCCILISDSRCWPLILCELCTFRIWLSLCGIVRSGSSRFRWLLITSRTSRLGSCNLLKLREGWHDALNIGGTRICLLVIAICVTALLKILGILRCLPERCS